MSIIRELIGMAMAVDGSAGSGRGSTIPNNGAYYNDHSDYSSRGRPLDRWQLREELRHERRVIRMYHRQARRENGLIRSGVRAVVRQLGQGPSGQQSQQPQLHVYEPTQTVPAYSRHQMQSVQEQDALGARPAHPQYGQQAYQYAQQHAYGQQGYVEPAPSSTEPMQESARDTEIPEPPPPYDYATRSETEKQPLSEELRR